MGCLLLLYAHSVGTGHSGKKITHTIIQGICIGSYTVYHINLIISNLCVVYILVRSKDISPTSMCLVCMYSTEQGCVQTLLTGVALYGVLTRGGM